MMGCFCEGSGLLLVVVMAGLSACAEVRDYIGCVVYVRMTERGGGIQRREGERERERERDVHLAYKDSNFKLLA